MLPLPNRDWYKQNPKPLNQSNNLVPYLVKTSLRIEELDYKAWTSRLSKCLIEGGLDCEKDDVSLQKQEHKKLTYKYINTFI